MFNIFPISIGDVLQNSGIAVNKEIECCDLSTVDTFETPEKPYYNKKRNSVIIYREFDIYR